MPTKIIYLCHHCGGQTDVRLPECPRCREIEDAVRQKVAEEIKKERCNHDHAI